METIEMKIPSKKMNDLIKELKSNPEKGALQLLEIVEKEIPLPESPLPEVSEPVSAEVPTVEVTVSAKVPSVEVTVSGEVPSLSETQSMCLPFFSCLTKKV